MCSYRPPIPVGDLRGRSRRSFAPPAHSALTPDAAGNLYGTTDDDGEFNDGQVFKLTRSGNGWIFTDLYDFFVNNDEGIGPVGGVTLDSDGNLYGTASRSGANGAGSVWEIRP